MTHVGPQHGGFHYYKKDWHLGRASIRHLDQVLGIPAGRSHRILVHASVLDSTISV